MRADIRAPNAVRNHRVVSRDPLLRNLLTKSPEEILTWWQTASRVDKDAITVRVIMLVAGLAQKEFN